MYDVTGVNVFPRKLMEFPRKEKVNSVPYPLLQYDPSHYQDSANSSKTYLYFTVKGKPGLYSENVPYTAKVVSSEYWVVLCFAIQCVRVACFTDPGQTCFAAHDVATAYGVVPA